MSSLRLLKVSGPLHELHYGEIAISAPATPDLSSLYVGMPPELAVQLPRMNCDLTVTPARDSRFDLAISLTREDQQPVNLVTPEKRGQRHIFGPHKVLNFLTRDMAGFLVVPDGFDPSAPQIQMLNHVSEKIALGAIARQLESLRKASAGVL